MKLFTKTYTTVLIASLFLYSVPLEANPCPQNAMKISTPVKKGKLVGIWDYTVQDVPPEYSKGVLHITKKKRQYMVHVELTNGTLTAQDVVRKKNKITFSLSIEDQKVDVALAVDGDTISGESSSPDGVFYLEGKRRS